MHHGYSAVLPFVTTLWWRIIVITIRSGFLSHAWATVIDRSNWSMSRTIWHIIWQCVPQLNKSENKIPSTIYWWTLKCRPCWSWVFLICWVDCSYGCRMEHNSIVLDCRWQRGSQRLQRSAVIAICSHRSSIWGLSKGQEDQWKGSWLLHYDHCQ